MFEKDLLKGRAIPKRLRTLQLAKAVARAGNRGVSRVPRKKLKKEPLFCAPFVKLADRVKIPGTETNKDRNLVTIAQFLPQAIEGLHGLGTSLRKGKKSQIISRLDL